MSNEEQMSIQEAAKLMGLLTSLKLQARKQGAKTTEEIAAYANQKLREMGIFKNNPQQTQDQSKNEQNQ